MRQVLTVLVAIAIAIAVVVSVVAGNSPAALAVLRPAAQRGPAQPITPTATIAATLTMVPETPTMTETPVIRPTNTATVAPPTRTPWCPPPSGELPVDWYVAPDRVLYVYRWPIAEPAATPEHYLTVEGDWPRQPYPLPIGWNYYVSVPGNTATIWPTDEPDTATPYPTDTPTPAPTQTARIVRVRVTVEVTRVVVVTATPRPLTPWVYVPLAGRRK